MDVSFINVFSLLPRSSRTTFLEDDDEEVLSSEPESDPEEVGSVSEAECSSCGRLVAVIYGAVRLAP